MEDETCDNLETYSIVWLDSSVDSNDEKLTIQKRLRFLIDYLKCFSNENLCENYLMKSNENERICLIISGQLGKDLVHHVHHLKQISMIYVFCIDKSRYQSWANQYPKIKAILNRSDDLIAEIDREHQRRIANLVDEPFQSINFNKNPQEFLFYQLLINCLLEMKILIKDRVELLNYLKNIYRQNEEYLLIIKQFQKDYSSLKSLDWFMTNSILTRILNKSIRNDHFYILFLIRFFIQDLNKQIHSNRIQKSIRIYKSQILSKEQFETLQDSLGHFITIKSFLKTNLNKKQCLAYFKEYHFNSNQIKILFEITANPNEIGARSLFTNVSTLGQQQVLFMVNSIFRIEKIVVDDKLNITFVYLNYSSIEHQEFELYPELKHSNLFSFGQLLFEKKLFSKAQIYFKHLIDHLPFDDEQVFDCFYSLGQIYFHLNQFVLSLKSFQKCLRLTKTSPSNTKQISIHNQIALVHLKENHYEQALHSYQQALTLSNPNTIQFVDSLNNIALVYKYLNHHQQALQSYQQIVAIQNQFNSPSDLALTYTNIAFVYSNLKQYELAIEYFNKVLMIYEEILPKKHCLISMIYESMGNVYYDQKQFKQAFVYYDKANQIYTQLLPTGHSDILQMKIIIQRIQSKIKFFL